MTDSEMVERVLRGDSKSYSGLVSRYQNAVYGLCYHYLRNFEDARDATQETFLEGYMHLCDLKDPEKFSSWLRTIGMNKCKAWSRRAHVQPVQGAAAVHDDTSRLIESVFVEQSLSSLSDDCRLAVVLHYFEEYSLAEIAQFLDLPITTIKSRLRNARLKLHKEMQKMVRDTLHASSPTPDFAAFLIDVIEAGRSGDFEKVQSLLEGNPDFATATNQKGHGALQTAAAGGYTALAELLLIHGADVNVKDVGDNATPLHYAAEQSHLEMVKLLVEHGANVDDNTDLHERGPLGWATVFGQVNTDIAEYLISKGARPDIFAAIAMSREDLVRQIVAADPSQLEARMSVFEDYRRPIPFAMSKGLPHMADLLVELGSPIDLLDAVALGSLNLVQQRLDRGVDPEQLRLALQIAVEAKQAPVVELLLKAGADPNGPVSENRTPIFLAVERCDEAVSRLLLNYGADLEAQDTVWHATALGWQVFFGHVSNVEFALRIGAKTGENLVSLAKSCARGEFKPWGRGAPHDYLHIASLLSSRST